MSGSFKAAHQVSDGGSIVGVYGMPATVKSTSATLARTVSAVLAIAVTATAIAPGLTMASTAKRRTATPRWLTTDERATWMALVHVLVELPNHLDVQLQRDAQLTHFEYGVMARLSEESEATMQLSALAAEMNASLSRLSHVLRRLEQRGVPPALSLSNKRPHHSGRNHRNRDVGPGGSRAAPWRRSPPPRLRPPLGRADHPTPKHLPGHHRALVRRLWVCSDDMFGSRSRVLGQQCRGSGNLGAGQSAAHPGHSRPIRQPTDVRLSRLSMDSRMV